MKIQTVEEANLFIDFLICEIHGLITNGDCVDMDCHENLKNMYYKEFTFINES